MLASEQATWGGGKKSKSTTNREMREKKKQVCGKMVWRKLITRRLGINKTLRDPSASGGSLEVTDK